MQFLLFYMLIINVAGFIIMLIDKENAKHQWARIPEYVLLSTAIFGGSFGVALAMFSFRHKIRKPFFTIAVAFCLAVDIALIMLIG